MPWPSPQQYPGPGVYPGSDMPPAPVTQVPGRVPIDQIGGSHSGKSADVRPPVGGTTVLEWLKEIAPDVYAQYVGINVPIENRPMRNFRDSDHNKRRPGFGRLSGTEGRLAGPGNGP